MTLLAVALVAAGLAYDVPGEWTSKPSSSSMRAAVWELAGDGAPAEVVIFYFGEGGGGGVEANLDRWFGQFEQPDGSSTRDKATTTKRTVNGLELTIADIRGTYVAPVRPGAQQRNNNAGHRMIAAVVEGGAGPWYIRVIGPEATVTKWETSVDAFFASLRLESP